MALENIAEAALADKCVGGFSNALEAIIHA
jgi:hypothetical protein